MIWHQIQANGLQSIVLTLVAVLLTLVLVEEAITATAVVTRTTGIATMLRTATTTFLSGVHFICNLKAEDRCQKSEVGFLMSEVRR